MNELADDAVAYAYILVSTSITADVTAIAQVKNTVMFVFQAWEISGITSTDYRKVLGA